MRFATLLEEACLLLDPLRPQLNPLPAEYALAGGSALELRGNFWWVPERGELRGVYIQGPKAEIVNLFFFSRLRPGFTGLCPGIRGIGGASGGGRAGCTLAGRRYSGRLTS